MATKKQITENAKKLKEAGAPDSVIQQYIEKATAGRSGLQKAGDIGKEVGLDLARTALTPFAMLAEGTSQIKEGITGVKGEQSGLEKFVFKDTERGTTERAGAAVERAVDVGSFLVPGGKGATLGKGFAKTAGAGGVVGGGFGLSSSLMSGDDTFKDMFTDTMLGVGVGAGLGGGLFLGGRALGAAGTGIKKTAGKVKETAGGVYDDVKTLAKDAEIFSKYFNDGNGKFQQASNDIADFAIDVNPELAKHLRSSSDVNALVKKGIKEGVDTDDAGVGIVKEMRSSFEKMKNGVQDNYNKVESEIINSIGGNQINSDNNIQKTFLEAVGLFNNKNGGKVSLSSSGDLVFDGLSTLSKKEQKALNTIFKEEILGKPNTIANALSTARIMEKGLPFDKEVTDALKNIPKVVSGEIRDAVSLAIDDPKWLKLNADYREFKMFQASIEELIGGLNKTPSAKKLDTMLNKFASIAKGKAPETEKAITKLGQESGKKFKEAIIANEILKDLSKKKGLSGANNVAQVMNRIFDPMKYTTLAGILNPEKLANSKTLAQGVREAATGGVSKSLQGVQKTAGGIDSTIKFLVAKASDPTLDRGLRALYILIIKELMFPTQTD